MNKNHFIYINLNFVVVAWILKFNLAARVFEQNHKLQAEKHGNSEAFIIHTMSFCVHTLHWPEVNFYILLHSPGGSSNVAFF